MSLTWRADSSWPISGAPKQRTGHTATLVHDFVVIFGGSWADGTCTAEVHILNPVTSVSYAVYPNGEVSDDLSAR